MPTVTRANRSRLFEGFENEGPRFSLGWELEATHAAVITPQFVERGRDGSVHEEGIEYRVKREIVNKPWECILELRKLLTLRRLTVNRSCGFHVHVGIQNVGREYDPKIWAAWCVALAKVVEDAAFKAVPESRRGNTNCRRWSGVLIERGVIGQSYNHSKYDNAHRYQWLNITEMFREGGIRTMEVRLCGESQRFDYLYSWICACLLMGKAAFRLMRDPSRLDYEASIINDYFGTVGRILNSAPGSSVSDIWELSHKAGLADYHFKNFEKFIKADVDSKSPPLNEPSANADMAYRYHRNRPQDRYGDPLALDYGHTFKSCTCDECNYYRYEKAKQKRKKDVETPEIAQTDMTLNAPTTEWTIDRAVMQHLYGQFAISQGASELAESVISAPGAELNLPVTLSEVAASGVERAREALRQLATVSNETRIRRRRTLPNINRTYLPEGAI